MSTRKCLWWQKVYKPKSVIGKSDLGTYLNISMKTFIIISLAIVALCAGVPVNNAEVTIVEQTYDQEPDGSKFKSAWETSDGTRVEAYGHLESDAEGNAGINIDGSAKYVDPEGAEVSWTWIAGPQGYVAQGAALPVGPPTPPAIARLVEFLATLPPRNK